MESLLVKDDLQKQADLLLASFLKDRNKGKCKHDEYPILSDTQLKRRYQKEIPYSNLTLKQRGEVLCKNYEMDCDVWTFGNNTD
jgi:hypothetical protein